MPVGGGGEGGAQGVLAGGEAGDAEVAAVVGLGRLADPHHRECGGHGCGGIASLGSSVDLGLTTARLQPTAGVPSS